MSLFRRKHYERAITADLVDQLRDVAERLMGWKVSGSEGVDLPRLLREAASEIESATLTENET